MKITLPERLAGTRDALFVLEVEFPVATEERKVEVATSGAIEALDLRGTGPGGTYDVPVGLERLHVPMRVTEDVEGEATVKITCTSGPNEGESEERTLLLEKGPSATASGSGGKLAIAAILVALLGGAAWWLGPKLFGGDQVPNVVGKTEKQAVAALQKAEYLAEIKLDDVKDRKKDGRVLRTIPPSGAKLAKGSKVEIVVGRAQDAMIKVDSVVGQTLDAAEAALRAAGFQPVAQYLDAEPGDTPGRVKNQSPAAGQFLDRGGEVQLFVPREPATPTPDVPTPDVPTPDQPTPDQPTPDQPTPDVPTPDVPTPDQPTPDQPTPGLKIPKLANLTLDEAKRALEAVGLVAITDFERVDVEAQNGRILRQFPDPGTPVSPGSQVILTIGRYSPPDVPTPDVPTPDQPTPDQPTPDQPTPDQPAPDQPTPDQPTPDQPTPDQPTPDQPTPDQPTPDQPTPDQPAPDQPTPDQPTPDQPAPDQPTPDQPVPDVPTPDQPMPDQPGVGLTVPDLIGLSRERATGLVRAAGFRYRVHLEETGDVPDGQVLSQRPTADSSAPAGSTIDVIVARAPAAAGVAVPDVVGKSREEAERILRAESFLVRATLGGGTQEQIGSVSAQSPAAGESRPRRTWVEIVVVTRVGESTQPEGGAPPSLPPTGDEGPRDPSTTDGMGRAPTVGDGPVVTPPPTPRGADPVPPVQLPGPDAAAANTVPKVANTPVPDAIRAVLEAGLIPIVDVDASAEGAAGQVLRQSPDGGSAVRAGALVRLAVPMQRSTQERTVTLPTALGGVLRKEAAALRAKGLTVDVVEVTAAGHPYAGTGRVAAQYPVGSVPRSAAQRITLWVVR